MINMTGNQARNAYCTYSLIDGAGVVVFYWHSRLAHVLGLRDACSNPNFDPNALHTVTIHTLHATARDASNAVAEWLKRNPWPIHNRTVRYSHYQRVRCIQTGQEFRNALECSKMMNVNQSQLSKLLRREPGHVTIKGLTFEYIIPAGALAPIRHG